MRSGTPAFCAFESFDAPGSSPTIKPVVLLETESETFAPSASSAAFASSRVKASSVPVTTNWLPGQRPFDRPVLVARLEAQPERAQFVHQRAVVGILEPLGNRLGPVGPDALDLLDVVHARHEQPVDVAEMTGKVARRYPPDVGDVETEEDARERLLLRQLDRVDDLRGRDLAVALELRDLLDGQSVEVGHRTQQTEIPETPDELLSDALDVHRGADPVDQRLQPARRDRRGSGSGA